MNEPSAPGLSGIGTGILSGLAGIVMAAVTWKSRVDTALETHGKRLDSIELVVSEVPSRTVALIAPLINAPNFTRKDTPP